jgi:hypothetical protein
MISQLIRRVREIGDAIAPALEGMDVNEVGELIESLNDVQASLSSHLFLRSQHVPANPQRDHAGGNVVAFPANRQALPANAKPVWVERSVLVYPYGGAWTVLNFKDGSAAVEGEFLPKVQAVAIAMQIMWQCNAEVRITNSPT